MGCIHFNHGLARLPFTDRQSATTTTHSPPPLSTPAFRNSQATYYKPYSHCIRTISVIKMQRRMVSPSLQILHLHAGTALTATQLTKEEEASAGGEDMEVRREDQEKINRFSSLHQKETALEEELRAKIVRIHVGRCWNTFTNPTCRRRRKILRRFLQSWNLLMRRTKSRMSHIANVYFGSTLMASI